MVGEIMHSKVVGVSFEGRQDIIANVVEGDSLILEREPSNAFDPNAIKVMWQGKCIGYISRDLARDLSDRMDKGFEYEVKVSETTGGNLDRPNRGVNIEIKVVKDGVIKKSARFL